MSLTTKLSSNLLLTTLIGSLLVLTACETTRNTSMTTSASLTSYQQLNHIVATHKQGSLLPFTPMVKVRMSGNNIEIRNGGYGSDAAAHPTNPMQFYALTDRGPNTDFTGSLGKGKMFPVPNYTPRIGLFEFTKE
ncbi:MAG TPA: phytase esterase-like protein, partial [Psychrobacter sp.]|nr:phytase esterase-like protein [Psychrobacter sp.]